MGWGFRFLPWFLSWIAALHTANFVTFKKLYEKPVFLKNTAQAFEAGDFLDIFLRFCYFWGSFFYKDFSYKNTCIYCSLKSLFFNDFSSIWFGGMEHFWPKNHRRKIEKIHKDFELYQVFIYNFLSQNILILPNHILTKRTKSIFIISTTSQLYQ